MQWVIAWGFLLCSNSSEFSSFQTRFTLQTKKMLHPHRKFVSREKPIFFGSHFWLHAPTNWCSGMTHTLARSLVPQLMYWRKIAPGPRRGLASWHSLRSGSRHRTMLRALGSASRTSGLIISASSPLWALLSLALKGRNGLGCTLTIWFIQKKGKPRWSGIPVPWGLLVSIFSKVSESALERRPNIYWILC